MRMDAAIATSFPLVAATHDEPLADPAANGMRYIAGQTGLWREVKLPWVRLRHRIATTQFKLPYADVDSLLEFTCGPMPTSLVREFLSEARDASPKEMAGVFLWNEDTDGWRYERRHGNHVTEDYISYTEVRPREGEHIVIDVHSHGLHPAFFSQQDNDDDLGSMKVSLVLGNVDRPTPSSLLRLCMAGHIVNGLKIDGDGQLGLT